MSRHCAASRSSSARRPRNAAWSAPRVTRRASSAFVPPCPARPPAGFAPKAIFVRPRMDAYKQESREIMRLVAETGATVEQMSIDEAYIDCSSYARRYESGRSPATRTPPPLARQLKGPQRIRAARQLTATIGIASNKLLAKIASDLKKPDGLTLIAERDKVQFLRPCPSAPSTASDKKTEEMLLNKAGIDTIGPSPGLPRRPPRPRWFLRPPF